MKTSLSISFLLLAAIFCASCFTIEPTPIYKVEPLGKEIRWLNGQAFVVEEDSTHTVVIGFYRSENNQLLFDLEVVNREGEMTLVDPASFYLKFESPSLMTTIPAVNPEAVLFSLEVEASREKARYQTEQLNDAAWGLADALVGLADNASAIGKKESNQDAEARRERNRDRTDRFFWREQVMNERKDDFRANDASFRNAREVISNDYLRKTSLTKGYRATGIVAFPALKWSQVFQIVLPVGDIEYAFWFRQAENRVELYPTYNQDDDLP